jgi:tRNA pseudouridine38-40 synthase
LKLEIQKKVVLVLEYDGAAYCGFQFQENAPTVQDEIEKALYRLTGEKVRVVAASRTDTGVHAAGQVVSFRTSSALATGTFIQGLNYYLPPDIAVLESYQVNNEFNVQREAVSREYRYLILNRATRSALQRSRTYQVSGELDIEAMNRACALLIGEQDLASFITAFSRSVIRSTLRTVYQARFERQPDMVVFDIKANAFLPHQVRNTVGALIRVGLGKNDLAGFQQILAAKKPGSAGPTVPAQGLFLIRINYSRPLGDYNENL